MVSISLWWEDEESPTSTLQVQLVASNFTRISTKHRKAEKTRGGFRFLRCFCFFFWLHLDREELRDFAGTVLQ